MQLREVIVSLLHNLGSKKEVSKYLNTFTKGDGQHRVVIKVGGGILADQLDELAAAIAFLSHVGIQPTIVHGAGPQLTSELEAAGIRPEFIEGQRVTSPEILAVARRVFQREGHRLADALERHGVRTRVFATGVFTTTQSDNAELGFVGEVERVDDHLIRDSLRNGALPIVSPLGETASGQILNVNADIATRELSLALQAQKIVFLTPTGGLLDPQGRIISAINLAEDYDRLSGSDWVHGGMALKLRQIRHLLEGLPQSASISITSPAHLASELFTHKGNGTLIRRGVRVRVHHSAEQIDNKRLVEVISQAFGRPLRTDYLTVNKDRKTIFIAGDYEAIAVVTHGGPVAYLDKFAVSSVAQGLGLAGSLWQKITAECPQLFWRSRLTNEINPWYTERADGMVRTSDWIVFWTGIKDAQVIEDCIRYALARPQTLGPVIPARKEAQVGV